mmetsp:Transcript_24494/g.73108  ORF Transcript_24494/g.73108 Transcript_24494/m.73108 type:complete len:241 (+) Transcript_24494:965-1687(+)
MPVDLGEVAADSLPVQGQEVPDDPPRRLARVLVRLLLRPGHAEGLTGAPVRVALARLDEQPWVAGATLRAGLDDKAQDHDVDHADQFLVLRRVQHEPRGAAAHLPGQLLQGLGRVLSEEAGVDVVLREHARKHPEVACLARHLRRHGALPAHLQDAGAFDALGVPPLVPVLRTRYLAVWDDELLDLVVCLAGLRQARGGCLAGARVMLQVEALHELLAPLPDAGVGPVVHDELAVLATVR